MSLEENLLAKRARLRNERRVTIKEEPSTSSNNPKIDSLVRILEIRWKGLILMIELLLDKISMHPKIIIKILE